MTVSTTDRREQFIVAAATFDYDFSFRALISTPTDIKAIATTGGTDTTLTYTTHYTVTINTTGIGGTVWLVDPTDWNDGTLTVYRETTETQESDYDDYNQFPADTLERNLDQLTILVQELSEDLDRSIKFAITSTTSDINFPEPEASKLIGWNSSADALINYTNGADTSLPSIGSGKGGYTVNAKSDESGYELIAAITSSTSTLQQTFDAGQSIVVASGDNQTLSFTQNDTVNNPVGINVVNTGTGKTLNLNNDSIGSSLEIDHDLNSALTAGSAIVSFPIIVDNANGSGDAVGIQFAINANGSAYAMRFSGAEHDTSGHGATAAGRIKILDGGVLKYMYMYSD